jgi:hypothetical protein
MHLHKLLQNIFFLQRVILCFKKNLTCLYCNFFMTVIGSWITKYLLITYAAEKSYSLFAHVVRKSNLPAHISIHTASLFCSSPPLARE